MGFFKKATSTFKGAIAYHNEYKTLVRTFRQYSLNDLLAYRVMVAKCFKVVIAEKQEEERKKKK